MATPANPAPIDRSHSGSSIPVFNDATDRAVGFRQHWGPFLRGTARYVVLDSGYVGGDRYVFHLPLPAGEFVLIFNWIVPPPLVALSAGMFDNTTWVNLAPVPAGAYTLEVEAITNLGNYYWYSFEIHGEEPEGFYLHVFKSTDNGDTWTELDPANAKQYNGVGAAITREGDKLYLGWWIGGANPSLRFCTFDLASETYGPVNNTCPVSLYRAVDGFKLLRHGGAKTLFVMDSDLDYSALTANEVVYFVHDDAGGWAAVNQVIQSGAQWPYVTQPVLCQTWIVGSLLHCLYAPEYSNTWEEIPIWHAAVDLLTGLVTNNNRIYSLGQHPNLPPVTFTGIGTVHQNKILMPVAYVESQPAWGNPVTYAMGVLTGEPADSPTPAWALDAIPGTGGSAVVEGDTPNPIYTPVGWPTLPVALFNHSQLLAASNGDILMFWESWYRNTSVTDPTTERDFNKIYYAIKRGGAGSWSAPVALYDSHVLGSNAAHNIGVAELEPLRFGVMFDQIDCRTAWYFEFQLQAGRARVFYRKPFFPGGFG